MNIDEATRLAQQLVEKREPRLAVWKELRTLILPDRGLFPDDTAEARARLSDAAKNYTNRQCLSLRRGAGGLTGAMTPAGKPWFHLGFAAPDIDELPGARKWLDDTEHAIGMALAGGGFYPEIHGGNKDLMGFGCMMHYVGMEESYDAEGFYQNRVHVECLQAGTYAVAVGQLFELQAVLRHVYMSASEMARRFGTGVLSDRVQQAVDTKPHEEFLLCHLVTRRAAREPGREDNRNMPFASYWFEDKGEKFLAESGYREMPFFFTVWEPGITAYGFGPADLALPEVRTMLNYERQSAVGIEMTIDPPMRTPAAFRKRLEKWPGGVNPMNAFEREAVAPLYQVDFLRGVSAIEQKIKELATVIDEMVYGRVFSDAIFRENPNETATATMARVRQMAQMVSPIVSRYEDVLTGMIMRVKSLLDEAQLLPPLPEALAGLGTMPRQLLQVSYVSPMAQALQQDAADSTLALISNAMPLVQMNQETLDKINIDQAIDEIAKGYGTPGSVVRSDQEVEAIRKARAEQMAAAQKQAEAQAGVDMMTKAGAIPTEGTVAGKVLG